YGVRILAHFGIRKAQVEPDCRVVRLDFRHLLERIDRRGVILSVEGLLGSLEQRWNVGGGGAWAERRFRLRAERTHSDCEREWRQEGNSKTPRGQRAAQPPTVAVTAPPRDATCSNLQIGHRYAQSVACSRSRPPHHTQVHVQR